MRVQHVFTVLGTGNAAVSKHNPSFQKALKKKKKEKKTGQIKE
jgi:hypothetical protein